MADVRLTKVEFRAGSRNGAPPLVVDIPNVTIIIGPNNSGKSLALREIEAECCVEANSSTVVSKVTVELPSNVESIHEALQPLRVPAKPDERLAPGNYHIHFPALRSGSEVVRWEISEADVRTRVRDRVSLQSLLLRPYTVLLSGRTRFQLADDKPTGPLEDPPQNHLWALFADDVRREKVRAFTEDAFQRHFVIDPTELTKFRVRLSERAPSSRAEEQSLDNAARAFHRSAALLGSFGDGVQTSVGLVSAVLAIQHRVILIDEPEAFLHPTLARRVGRLLSETARTRNATMIAATHSADFLRGCIEATPTLRLIRLSFVGGEATARSIDPVEIASLMKDPLLRSANALRAPFHSAVVVCESDADRAFYEEINSRLQLNNEGIDDCLYMNAQNWQTIRRIVTPLRRLGVPAAAIMDFDVLLKTEFSHVWQMLNADSTLASRMQSLREQMVASLDESTKKAAKRLGIQALPETNRERATELIELLSRHGLFIVVTGELESWLTPLGMQRTGNKSGWLTTVFDRLGNDPDHSDFVRPANGDVWKFARDIRTWTRDSRRLGVPD